MRKRHLQSHPKPRVKRPPSGATHPVLATDEMHFVHDEEVDVLNVLALLPAPREDVPLLRGADDDVAFTQELEVSAGLPRQQHHLFEQPLLELLMPVQENL